MNAYTCLLCTSGRDSGGLLYQFDTPWVGCAEEPPEECPQCGGGAGIVLAVEEIVRLSADVQKHTDRITFIHSWYATRLETLKAWAKEHGHWDYMAGVLANDGNPPTFARVLAMTQHRAEKAEAERDKARAELEEARLTLAAEQGKREGAPSEGWVYEGRDWSKTYPDGSFAGLSGSRGKRSWMRALWPDTTKSPRYLGRGFDVETDRAAMIAADAANP